MHPENLCKDVSCIKDILAKNKPENAIRNTSASQDNGSVSPPTCVAENREGGAAGCVGAKRKGGTKRTVQGGEKGKEETERTVLEVAVEAAVVRATGVGEEARKELRLSMSR